MHMRGKDIAKPKEYLSGQLDIPGCDIKIDCYVLDNGDRVLTQRGIQRILGIPQSSSGDVLKKYLLSFNSRENKPANYKEVEAGFNEVCSFHRKGAGGSQPDAKAYDAAFLMDVCHFIQDLDRYNLLPLEWKFLNQNATIIERAFSKLGIYAYIDEATGYIKEKRKEEYRELFNQFLTEEAEKWHKLFPDDFFEIIWKLWLQKKSPKNSKRPGFFGHIINKYVYMPLAIDKLHMDPKKARGVLLEQLNNKNPVKDNKRRKYRHTQFLNDIGQEVLKEHLLKLITIGKISPNKNKFNENFARLFNMEYDKSLFDEE